MGGGDGNEDAARTEPTERTELNWTEIHREGSFCCSDLNLRGVAGIKD